MAENHPVGFQWVMEARERGAKIIHVDPRFTRTSAMADVWAPLRAGSDVVMLGAIVNYVLQNELAFREYVVHYTNAPVILRDDFKDTEDLEGLFSGWDDEKKEYKTATWAYKDAPGHRNWRDKARAEATAKTAAAKAPMKGSTAPIRRYRIRAASIRF